jgi:hypothetical protein
VPLIADEDFIEMLIVAGPGPAPARPVSVDLPELRAPLPDSFIADHDAALQHQLLDLTKAQREPGDTAIHSGRLSPAGTGVPCTTMQRSRPPILAATRQTHQLDSASPTDVFADGANGFTVRVAALRCVACRRSGVFDLR